MAQGFTPQDWLVSIYVAYWGRAADPGGLDYWMDQWGEKDHEGRIKDAAWFAANFAMSDEAAQEYEYFGLIRAVENFDPERHEQEISSFVRDIYWNLFDRFPALEAREYWTEQLIQGNVSEGEFIATIVDSALHQGGVDAAVITAKKDVAWRITEQIQDMESEKALAFVQDSSTKRIVDRTTLQNIQEQKDAADEAVDEATLPDYIEIPSETLDQNTSGTSTRYWNIEELLHRPGRPEAKVARLEPDTLEQAYIHVEPGDRFEFDHDTFVVYLDEGSEYMLQITPEDPSVFESNNFARIHDPFGDWQETIISEIGGFEDGILYSQTFKAQYTGNHFLTVSMRLSLPFGEEAEGPEPYDLKLVDIDKEVLSDSFPEQRVQSLAEDIEVLGMDNRIHALGEDMA